MPTMPHMSGDGGAQGKQSAEEAAEEHQNQVLDQLGRKGKPVPSNIEVEKKHHDAEYGGGARGPPPFPLQPSQQKSYARVEDERTGHSEVVIGLSGRRCAHGALARVHEPYGDALVLIIRNRLATG